jgi:NAD(P)-dependent dehydrogenase (short-subunit alcohol dehydrogenase family)
MNLPLSFKDKSVFVAGGSSGINLGVATAFAQAGARVAIVSRNAERVAGAVQALLAYGGQVEGYSADVRDPEAIAAVLLQAREAMGPFDVLVSGAAGNFVAPALGMSAKGFKTVVDIDLNGTFHVLRAGFEHLNRPGACVLNISAPQAFNPTRFQAHVCAAKAGVDMLTRVLAMEWGAEGVRVNSIVPGPIGGTEGIRRLAPTPEAVQRMTDSVPLQRMGRVDEIGDMAMSPISSTRPMRCKGTESVIR